MADRGDTHYQLPKLNLWFTVSSILLLVASIWMVIDDWSRPWKNYQREFRQIETERAKAQLATADSQAAMAEEERLGDELEQEQARLDQRQAEIAEAEEELRQLRGVQFNATEAAKKAKQEYNWERWVAEEHRLHEGDPTLNEETLREYEDKMLDLAGEKEAADFAVLEAESKLAELREEVVQAEQAIKAATKDIDLVRKKLASLDPEDAPTQIANIIRDFPGLDFIGPNLKVNKVVLEDLTFDLNFTTKKRIDMCTTCHNAIDRAGFTEEDLEQPHRSHPNLDLYLTAKSPHPMSEVGCTICHRGSGESLDFQRADHRPSSEEEGREWYDKYHWHKQHYWDYPMLSSTNVEASCVQCHKDSMELIAPDAPKVSEGYQLFERYGCYACHKVDWFPTKRRPGPSLKQIAGKTRREFVDSWIKHPKAFRPTTWMPKIFHLENYAPEAEVVVSEYGTGRPILGQEWNDNWMASVVSYIWDRSDKTQFPEIPVEGDALRGRETFRLTGCLACHNMSPYTEAEQADVTDRGQIPAETNEHGPNLRGIATKVSPEWLFAWLKDPASYWSETRMPDLRLSDEEAADIVAYIMEDPEGIFTDVPDGWVEQNSPYDREVLEEQARWFFNRAGREELARRFREEWSDDEALLQAIGEKVVLNQGCHSCHEIQGLENAMPIGAELTNWASKTVDKLDFGFMPEILAEQHGWSYHEKLEFKEYREGWLEQKLHEPRSYDRRKVKNPTEKLRMPWFEFSRSEIEAITTFVAGLVEDEVQQAKMVPTAEQLAMNHGLQVLRQKNCAACHVIEPGMIDFMDEDGVHRSVRGRILTLEEDLLPPPLDDFQAYVEKFTQDAREFLEDEEFEVEEAIVQLLEPVPGLGDVGTTVVVEDVASIETEPAWGGTLVDLVVDHYQYPGFYDPESDADVFSDPDGEGLVRDVDGEWRDYSAEPYDKVRWTFAPPSLVGEGAKVQRDWFYQFLVDPVPLRQQIRVRMPTFNWGEGEAGAVADYFAVRAKEQWPERYSRKFLLERDQDPEEVVQAMAEGGYPTVTADQLKAILQGKPVETKANFPRVRAFADAEGFEMAGPVNPSYEPLVQRTPSHLGPLLEENPEYFEDVHTMLAEGPNCFQCHFMGGEAPTAEGPIAWAPDLDITRERLRPDWLEEWLSDPSKIYPGTAMPANFPAGERVWQEFLALPSDEQIDAVVTWLMNLDRAKPRN